jgi:hypothetical protein
MRTQKTLRFFIQEGVKGGNHIALSSAQLFLSEWKFERLPISSSPCASLSMQNHAIHSLSSYPHHYELRPPI